MKRHAQRGLTMLELMIVIAIIGMGAFLVRGGIRVLTKAALVEDATSFVMICKRASQLSIERGEIHRVLMDIDKGIYIIEACQGSTAITRNEKLRADEEETKQAVERGTQKMADLPSDALATGDAETAAKRAMAVAGHHIQDRMCAPTEAYSGAVDGQTLQRVLRAKNDVKFKEVWVQHLDDSVTKDQAAIYFFPGGSAEKAVVELTDGEDTMSVLVHGLTGRIELRSGTLRDVDDHMMKNALGNKDKKRETEE